MKPNYDPLEDTYYALYFMVYCLQTLQIIDSVDFRKAIYHLNKAIDKGKD